ncbi:hypothetical protein I3843_04G069800 [Carya illinoinensis]|nr:hypothetical protein I3843_04G069800 [Carya illinoinensis]
MGIMKHFNQRDMRIMVKHDTSNYIPSNIYDPAQWKHVDTKLRDLFVENGPIRYNDINFPKDENFRHFSTTYYIRKLSNGEKHDRKCISQLANEGTDEWKNLSAKLKIHETTNEHITNMTTWLDLEMKLLRNKTIDKNLIEMIFEFDLVMQKHIWCIQDGEIHNQYLATELKNHIIKKIKDAKYFSIILDCTPDANDTSGKGIFNELLDTIKNLDFDINNIRRQGYDNGPTYLSLFSSSTKRWKILQDNMSILTLKPLLQTCWESRIESIKAIKFQIPQIRETLLQLAKMTEDPKTKSEANCLIAYEIVNFEFILGMTICKSMQSKDMHIDVVIDQLKGLISYFQDYGENGFKSTMISSKVIAISMEIELVFREKQIIYRKKQFDENIKQFLQFKIILKEILSIEENTPIDILNYIKRLDSFPNAYIAYRILLIERLNGLAILSIKKEILEELEYKNLISNFASQKVRRIIFK